MKAIWNGIVLAESEKTELVEGNHYFPLEDVKQEFFSMNEHRSTCPWKGEARYYDLIAGDDKATNAAWTYPNPKEAAQKIANYIAFYPIVEIQ